MLPASGSPRSTMIPESTPSSSTATRTSNGSTLAKISLPILESLPRTLRPSHRADQMRRGRGGVESYPHPLVAHADVQEQRRRPHHRHERASAVTDERQGDAGDRHDPHGHPDGHEDVERDHGNDPDRRKRAESIAGHRGNAETAVDP